MALEGGCERENNKYNYFAFHHKEFKMARHKKSKNPIELEIGGFIAVLIYVYTSNIKLGIGAFILCLIIAMGIIYIKSSILKEKYINSGIDTIDKFSGEEFERFLLAHFKNLGYKGELTPKTNDYGADLALSKAGSKVVVQAKRWTNAVGIKAIQEIIGAKEYYKADSCLVVTNNYFTPNAIKLAASSNVELWDRDKLIEIMAKANGKEIVEKKLVTNNITVCKICGGIMTIKAGRYGKFYGCINYPKCRHTCKL